MWNLRNSTNELIYKTKTLTDIENKLTVPKGQEGGINWEYGINRHTLPCKIDKQQEFTVQLREL